MTVPVTATTTLTIDFAGEVTELEPGATFTIGREGDLSLDDNPYLHRRFLELAHVDNLVWLANVGSAISATIADEEGLVQSWLSPGARVPLVFAKTVVWFTAGPTTYEFDILLTDAPFVPAAVPEAHDGSTTLGRVTFTPDQRLLVLALAEPILRRGNRGAGSVPPSAAAAERLGWTITKFNRKLDNVCQKLADAGTRGLHGGPGKLASNRKARLVEHALSTRMVTEADLALLD